MRSTGQVNLCRDSAQYFSRSAHYYLLHI